MAKTATIIEPKQWKGNKPVRRKINLRTPVGRDKTATVEVIHKDDPKQALLKQIGTIPDGLVQFSRILVALYVPPTVEKTAGGVHLPDSLSKEELQEYLWQGKVGLIVAMGERAYESDDSVNFHGTRNNIGDWVWYRPSDGDRVEVNEVQCRIFECERFIRGRVPHPDYIW